MKVAVPANTPHLIPFKLGPDAELVFLTHNQFHKLFGCIYTEQVYVEDECLTPLESITQNDILQHNISFTPEQIANHLQNPCKDLYLMKFEDPVGCGVFTNRAFEQGEIVGTYAGVIKEDKGILKYTCQLRVNNILTQHRKGLKTLVLYFPKN